MCKTENLEEYCKIHIIAGGQGKMDAHSQFGIFRQDDFIHPYQSHYCRRDFYQIRLISGPSNFHYGDQVLSTAGHLLLFCEPSVPYGFELTGDHYSGYTCLIKEAFFDQHQKIKTYPLFIVGKIPAFELDNAEAAKLGKIFERIFEELESDFLYKFDVVRSLILEIIYQALKMTNIISSPKDSNGSLRLTSMFNELLEQQFPVETPTQRIKLRFPVDFADLLSVHVNHLNRSLKKVTGKTTSQLIAERILKEARLLLRRTEWNVSEIGWSLGFEELPCFIKYFRRGSGMTPNTFRKTPIY